MKKNNIGLFLIVLIMILLSSCNNSSGHPSNDIQDWVGYYESVMSTKFDDSLPDSDVSPNTNKTVIYSLSIYQEKNQYFADFTAEGWLTYYKVKATVVGESNKISIIYDSYIDGVNSFTIADPVPGDVLYKMIKIDNRVETSWSWPNENGLTDSFEKKKKTFISTSLFSENAERN